MKRTMIVAGVVALVAVVVGFAVPAMAGPGEQQGGGKAGGMRQEGGPGGQHQGMGGMMDDGHMLAAAAREPWARGNAEVQQLVDKVIADRKVMIRSEEARVAALEKLVQAGRGGDETAIKTAAEAMRAATEKLRADAEQVREDVKSLGDKLRELKPAGGVEGQGVKGGTAGEGQGFRGGRPEKGNGTRQQKPQ